MVSNRLYFLSVVVSCLLSAVSPLAHAAASVEPPELLLGGVAPLTPTGAHPLDPTDAPVDSGGGDDFFRFSFLLACASEKGKSSITVSLAQSRVLSHMPVDRA